MFIGLNKVSMFFFIDTYRFLSIFIFLYDYFFYICTQHRH